MRSYEGSGIGTHTDRMFLYQILRHAIVVITLLFYLTCLGSTEIDIGSLLYPDQKNITQVEGRFDEFYQALLTRNYTFGKMPQTPRGEPLTVLTSVYVNRLVDLNEEEMVYTIDFYLRQVWQDPGMANNGISDNSIIHIPDQFQPQFWTPDTFIQNSKDTIEHILTKPNQGIFVYGNGTVMFSIRMTVHAWCHILLQDFPMDKQRCALRLMTYRYSIKLLRFQWMSFEDEQVDLSVSNLPMSTFKITNSSSTRYCTTTYFTGGFSCLVALFEFERQYGYYLTQVYLPTILIVSMSWISFWLSPECSPARISLGITTLLTMASQMGSSAVSSLPKVSYIKYIDIWVTACMSFLVSAITEYAIVYNLWRRPIEQLYRQHEREDKLISKQLEKAIQKGDKSYNLALAEAERNIPLDHGFKAPRFTAVMVDQICRVLFPALFALFNLVYWIYPVVYSRAQLSDSDI